MTVVLLGLVSSLLYGISDFFGAVASRARPATGVAFVALVVAAAAVVPAFAFVPSAWSLSAVVLGACAGGAAGVGVLLLYAALAAGPVGFVSPVVALMSAVLPALLAVATGERTSGWSLAALGAIVVGGVLIGAEPDAGLRPHRRTVLLTAITGLLYATYFVLMDATPADSGAVPMLADSVAAAVVVGGILLGGGRARGGARPTAREWALMLAAGAHAGHRDDPARRRAAPARTGGRRRALRALPGHDRRARGARAAGADPPAARGRPGRRGRRCRRPGARSRLRSAHGRLGQQHGARGASCLRVERHDVGPSRIR